MMVNQTLVAVSVGAISGGMVAAIASRVLVPYLFGVTAYDPITYAAIFGLIAGVGILASWVPAQRAGRVEPAIVLRGEWPHWTSVAAIPAGAIATAMLGTVGDRCHSISRQLVSAHRSKLAVRG